jgi:adenosine kinase
MKIIVTGSIAFDYLMSFPGSFSEHLLPGHLDRVSLSFLVDSMDKRRGGCAPNIAYTLALLGERPRLMGTAGQDFGEYRQWLERAGVDTSLVKEVSDKFTASFFCSTDKDGNQIASFYTGAMAHAGEMSFAAAGECDLAIISPNDPGAMVQYAEECHRLKIPYIFDPSQQVARMNGEDLVAGVVGARIVICNDYENEIIRQKTGLDAEHMLASYRHMFNHQLTRGVRDYWSDHMCASFMVDPLGLELIDKIGVQNVMWSSDYPHNESTFGYSEKSLKTVVDAVGPEAATKIVSTNIKNFLGVE